MARKNKKIKNKTLIQQLVLLQMQSVPEWADIMPPASATGWLPYEQYQINLFGGKGSYQNQMMGAAKNRISTGSQATPGGSDNNYAVPYGALLAVAGVIGAGYMFL